MLAMVPTLLGITLITFMVINLAPGDPVQASFETGGAGAGEDGGGGDQDRLGDSIKAKQQLLGLMAEDHSLLSYEVGRANADGLAPLWHSREVALPDWARRMAPVADGVWVGSNAGSVALVKGGQLTTTIEAHDEAIWALAAWDGGVAAADKKGDVGIWTPDGTEVARIEGDGKAVRSMAYSDGKIYVASDSGSIREIDVANGSVLREFAPHIGGVYAVEVVGDKLYSGGSDRELMTTDLGTGEVVQTGPQHGAAINDIEASPDGEWLASAADDRKVRRMPLNDGLPGEPTVFEGHYKKATAVAIGEGGSPLVSGSADELVRTWDVETGASTGLAAESTGTVHDLALVDGQMLAAGSFWYKVPVTTRYLKWLGRIVTLDFGRSFIDDEKVIDKIAKALPVTIGLNLLAIFIIYAVSVPLGIAAAVKRGQLFDNVSSVILFVLYSIPNFWLATMLIMFLSSSLWFDLFPSGKLNSADPWGMSYWPWLMDRLWHLVLPITVMVYAGFASLSRYVRTSMLEALSQDFVRTARAKGLSELVVVGRHAFRNALITIVTLIGNLLPRMIGGSVIVEYIFSIDGMGKLGFDAILSRDYPVIMAITTFAAVLTLLGILVSDLLYGAVDPRVRVNQ